jgi:glycosyltransferase involved in cell wall biosynthesis
MKVIGFTFVRNAVRNDYPVLESLRSLLPLCEEIVVAVGNSDDGTLDLVRSLESPKIRILETVWDDTLRVGGHVLAQETDKALAAVPLDADWAIYLQADEVLHEQDYSAIRAGMTRWQTDPAVDGLLLCYHHFYATYDYVADSPAWYQREIRVVRPGRGIYSYRDAQGFRKPHNQKLRVKLVEAQVYHYGSVKQPAARRYKNDTFGRLWHSDEYMAAHVAAQPLTGEELNFQIDSLQPFGGTHPVVMAERIACQNWHFTHDPSRNHYRFKDRIRRLVLRLTGYHLWEYRNYILR